MGDKMTRGIRQGAAVVLLLAALVPLVTANGLGIFTGVIRDRALFITVLQDRKLLAGIAARFVKDPAAAALFVEAFRKAVPDMVDRSLLPAWETYLDGERPSFDPVLSVRGQFPTPVERLLAARFPGGIRPMRLLDAGTRGRMLLAQGRLWYGRIRKGILPLYFAALSLMIVGFLIASDRIRVSVPLLFSLTVVSLTIALFILLFRQQVHGLAGAALVQLSRNTIAEQTLLRVGLDLVMDSISLVHLVAGISALTGLVGLRFRTARRRGV